MKFFRHIFAFLAALLIFFPSAVSFAHVFSGHSHKVCTHYSEKHVHPKKTDCELHKFHHNPALEVEISHFEPATNLPQKTEIFSFYQFLSDYQKLPFELRGPPSPAFS